jgi:hypothetical protein
MNTVTLSVGCGEEVFQVFDRECEKIVQGAKIMNGG